jgi:hypothetical protein
VPGLLRQRYQRRVTGFRKESNAGPCQPARFRALTRPVPGDSVLQVVDMRDTAIGGHRDYAIAHDLACPPGHFVNRIGAQMVVYFLFLTAGVRDRRKS